MHLGIYYSRYIIFFLKVNIIVTLIHNMVLLLVWPSLLKHNLSFFKTFFLKVDGRYSIHYCYTEPFNLGRLLRPTILVDSYLFSF